MDLDNFCPKPTWTVVMCDSNTPKKTHVQKRLLAIIGLVVSLIKEGELYDQTTSMRIFTLLMNKIFI